MRYIIEKEPIMGLNIEINVISGEINEGETFEGIIGSGEYLEGEMILCDGEITRTYGNQLERWGIKVINDKGEKFWYLETSYKELRPWTNMEQDVSTRVETYKLEKTLYRIV